MRIVEARDYADLSRKACEMVVARIRTQPSSVCVFPTGDTPLGLFDELVAAHRAGSIDASTLRIVTLDEYAGIARDDRRRLFLWLRRALLHPLGIPDDRIYAFDPAAPDPVAEAWRIETVIADLGGIDLAVLGLGANGHLGFNEPGSPFDSRARLVKLTEQSIRANAVYWGSEAQVPRNALTLGLGTLSNARAIILLASGGGKAEILARAVEGPIGLGVPATSLRLHRDATAIAEREALAQLPRRHIVGHG